MSLLKSNLQEPGSCSGVRFLQGTDYHHPLFLHTSDAPSSMSIRMPLIGMENYSLWREVMQLYLLTRNKLGFVDDSISRDTFGKDYALLWDRCNAIVKSWIMHNMSRDLINGVLFRSVLMQFGRICVKGLIKLLHRVCFP